MNRDQLLNEMTTAIKSVQCQGWTAEQREDCPASDMMLRTACYAAFFAIVSHSESVEERFTKLQGEIATLRDKRSESLPHDFELVLLAMTGALCTAAMAQQIQDNRLICRKFVRFVDGHSVIEILETLPFWPPPRSLASPPIQLVAGAGETLVGFDSHLIADLSSRSPGVERVAEKIIEKQYEVDQLPAAKDAIHRSQSRQVSGIRIKDLEISNFRGIRSIKKEDMPLSGDIVVIYGPNGIGKTSIADALEWVVTGQIERISQQRSRTTNKGPDPIVNMFSKTDIAKVVCRLGTGTVLCREKQGHTVKRSVDQRSASDDRTMIDSTVGTKAPSSGARLQIQRLRELFRGSHLLAQHSMRDFLQTTDPSDRFDILTNMIGAEEFVRFREKVGAVRKHLESSVRAATSETKEKNQDLEKLHNTIQGQRSNTQKLQQTLLPDCDAEVMISSLFQKLKGMDVATDTSALSEFDEETIAQRLQLAAFQVDPLIQAKRLAIQGLLTDLNVIEQELPNATQVRDKSTTLKSDIAKAETAAGKMQSEMAQMKSDIGQLRDTIEKELSVHKQRKREHQNLLWLSKTLAPLAKMQTSHREIGDALSKQRKKIGTFDNSLAQKRKATATLEDQLRQLEKKIALCVQRQKVIADLQQRLSQIESAKREYADLEERENFLVGKCSEQQKQLNIVQTSEKSAKEHVRQSQQTYDSIAARHDARNQLLASLVQLVEKAECPLCGRDFASLEEAKVEMQAQLTSVPTDLKQLADVLETAKKHAVDIEKQRYTISSQIQGAERDLAEIKKRRAAAEETLRVFLSECQDVSIRLSDKDSVSWSVHLKQAMAGSDTSTLQKEAAQLRRNVEDSQAKLEKELRAAEISREDIQRAEKEFARIATSIDEVRADMLEHGFQSDSLLTLGGLTSQIELLQGQLEKGQKKQDKLKQELESIERRLGDLKSTIAQRSEDILVKKAQCQSYESAWTKFTTKCTRAAVDLSQITKSIRDQRNVLWKTARTLDQLEKDRQALLQLSRLEELREQTGILEKQESSLAEKFEKMRKKETYLRGWSNRLEDLQLEVSKQQVSVVGAHLEQLEPIIQHIYNRLNPHPLFKTIKIQIDDNKRELAIHAVTEPLTDDRNILVSPRQFFSDAQMNVLAIAVFLAGVLSQRWSGLQTVLIDDPIQQMDEMNVCAFLDLIRGLANARQFIIFTCSRDFYLLALDKLECLNKTKPGSFLAYRLEGIAPSEFKIHCDTSLQ